MKQYSVVRPDDFHCHLRDGEMFAKVLPYSNLFGKVVIMGNLIPPIITGKQACDYKNLIKEHGAKFEPIMSIMLVNETTPKMIYDAFECGVKVLKLIPGGVSTGSCQGVALKNLHNYYHILKIVEDCGMIFSGHWELVSDPSDGGVICEYDRESRAIPYLCEIVDRFPNLQIVVEHISTAAMVNFVLNTPKNVVATVTAHHLGPFQYKDVIDSFKIKNPYLYCKPVLKYSTDIEVLRDVVLSGNPKFFFGSDSAPHLIESKRQNVPSAGIFSAPVAIPFLFQIFTESGSKNVLDDFGNFVSNFGSSFYGLPKNDDTITIIRKEWEVPSMYDGIVPFMARRRLSYKILS